MTTGDLELTAYHEAAHGTIRSYFGHEVAELSLNGAEGNCHYSRVRSGDLGLFQDMAAILAGRIAEDRLCGHTNEEWKGSGDDYDRAFDCALRLNGGDRQGAQLLLQWMEYRTEKLVEKHWRAIQRLAFKLLDTVDGNGNACLSGDQIRKAIARILTMN